MHQHSKDAWCSSSHLRKCRMTMDVEINYRYIARVNLLVSENKNVTKMSLLNIRVSQKKLYIKMWNTEYSRKKNKKSL